MKNKFKNDDSGPKIVDPDREFTGIFNGKKNSDRAIPEPSYVLPLILGAGLMTAFLMKRSGRVTGS